MKITKLRTIVTLCAVLVLASGGLYYLNQHQSKADSVSSSASDVAANNFAQSDSSTSVDQSFSDSSANSSVDSTPSIDNSTDSANIDNSGSTEDSVPVVPTTSTTGTVSAAQSSALLDKVCIASSGTDYATIDTIIKDNQGDILVGDSYKPQVNVSPLTGLTGNISNISDGEWLIKIKSTTDQLVTAKVGSQGILIATLSLNFSSNCPPETTAAGTDNTTDPTVTDSNGTSVQPTDTTTPTNIAPVAPNIKTNQKKTAGSLSTSNIIYLVGGVIVFILLLAGGFVLFLKKKQNNGEFDETEEIESQGPEPIATSQPQQDSQPPQGSQNTQASQPPQDPPPPLPPQA